MPSSLTLQPLMHSQRCISGKQCGDGKGAVAATEAAAAGGAVAATEAVATGGGWSRRRVATEPGDGGRDGAWS